MESRANSGLIVTFCINIYVVSQKVPNAYTLLDLRCSLRSDATLSFVFSCTYYLGSERLVHAVGARFKCM